MEEEDTGMDVQFADFTAEEAEAVKAIIARAAAMEKAAHRRLDRLSLNMDLSAAHAAVGLDLARLAAFPDFDFAHDVYGIMRHMDRTTGKLGGYFLPRCTRRQTT